MGTIIIKNLSTLDDTAALIRVGFYMNGDPEYAMGGGVIVDDTTTRKDEETDVKRFVVYEK